jgi:hypothetical protein
MLAHHPDRFTGIILLAAALLVLPGEAQAQSAVSKDALEAVKDRVVILELSNGGEVRGKVLRVTDISVIVERQDGKILTLAIKEVVSVKTEPPAAPRPDVQPPVAPPPPGGTPPPAGPAGPGVAAGPRPPVDPAEVQARADRAAGIKQQLELSAFRSKRARTHLIVGASMGGLGLVFTIVALSTVGEPWTQQDITSRVPRTVYTKNGKIGAVFTVMGVPMLLLGPLWAVLSYLDMRKHSRLRGNLERELRELQGAALGGNRNVVVEAPEGLGRLNGPFAGHLLLTPVPAYQLAF